MMAARVLLTFLLLQLTAVPRLVYSSAVIELTDENFDTLTKDGVWMVNVYSPGCLYCRQLEPLWEVFAEEAKPLGVSIGRIDGTVERVLMSRFKVSGFPSIFLLREGRTYTYSGARNVEAFKKFAVKGYSTATPLPFYKAPNSAVGRIIGRVHSIPSLIKRAYRILRHERGWSDTTIVLGFLAVPVLTGALLICALDAMYIRRARADYLHEHEE